MLLSFAQFEREITGERIRDKVAVSKRKGLWMGGAVPLGYRVEDRALHVVEDEAEFVRSLFRRYLELGSVVRLKTALDAENIRSPVRTSTTGRKTGGVPISSGHLYWILSNPIHIGRLRHKGQIHDGLHQAIIDWETWQDVQPRLAAQTQSRRAPLPDDHSFRAGKLFDDRGNSGAQRERPPADTPLGKNIRNAIDRATVSATRIEIVLCECIVGEGQDRLLEFTWTRTSSRRRHEIIQGVDELKRPQRAMRTKARVGFVKAFGAAHRWLDELLSDANTSLDSLAVRAGKSERSIRMTLSLAFLSPVLAEAAMDGRLPRGFSIRRLTELPVLWSEQWTALGLREPIQTQAAIGG